MFSFGIGIDRMLNTNIVLPNGYNLQSHAKASEDYIAVKFYYEGFNWSGLVPINYRRTGLNLKTPDEINSHLNKVYDEIERSFNGSWHYDQEEYWRTEKSRAHTTKSFFDALAKDPLSWKCPSCDFPVNKNPARRLQDLKEFGYTIATSTNSYCHKCMSNQQLYMMLPIPRVALGGNGYETWSPALRKRILNVLGGIDVYENKYNKHALPDHKFPEIRWGDDTKAENPDTMTDQEIRSKFQLLTNQRNQEKREVCRQCYQTGQRGKLFGVSYFYKGGPTWNALYPATGKAAEQGCVGCGWYDIAAWRESINKTN